MVRKKVSDIGYFEDYVILCEILSHIPVGSRIHHLERQLLKISAQQDQNSLFNRHFPTNRYHYSPNLDVVLGGLIYGGSLSYSGPSLQILEVGQGVCNMVEIYAKQLSDENRRQLASFAAKIDYN